MNKKRFNLLFGGANKKITLSNPDDTYVIKSVPDTNYVTNGTLPFRVSATTQRQSLLKFDLTSIPAGSKIIRATLNLFSYTAPTAATVTYSVYPILAANSDMVFAEMTWNIKKTGTAWAGDAGGDGGDDGGCMVAGTDFNSVSMGTGLQTVGMAQGTKIPFILNKDVVEGWLTNNYGMIIFTDKTEVTVLYSANNVDAAAVYKPTLDIVYK